jgi:ABC-type multidrug transport system ATPase subunit
VENLVNEATEQNSYSVSFYSTHYISQFLACCTIETVHREKKGKQVVSETPKNFVQSNHTKKPNPSQRIQNEQLQHNHIEQKTMVERKQTSLREKAARATWCYVCVTHRFSFFFRRALQRPKVLSRKTCTRLRSPEVVFVRN